MKIVLILFLPLSIYAQVEIVPEKNSPLVGLRNQAFISSENAKPYWIGIGNNPIIHLDSSENYKVGIGTNYKKQGLIFTPWSFVERAKVHIRHEGGSGEFQNQKGPHLLLDEATADRSAAIRFRQSTILESSSPGGALYTYEPGARYWDVLGFANGVNTSFDNFRIKNSGNPHDLFELNGTGNMFLRGEGSTKLALLSSNTTGVIRVDMGETTGVPKGQIAYSLSTNHMEFKTNTATALELSDDGFVSIGSDAAAPNIKTWYGTITLSSTAGVTTNILLPSGLNKSDVLSIKVMVTNTLGNVVEANNDISDCALSWTLNNNTLSLKTDNIFSSLILGRQARVFVIYKD